ncbi:MAG: zinc ribbon domain-containing protein [Colwellia sp.]|nr:zinc ribbon domain-containing protein [Colwellia sp.]
MAVINCPNCQKKISDKAKSCSHCQVDLVNIDVEQIASMKKVDKINKSQSLMNHSFFAMLLFCGGFLFLFWQDAQQGTWQYFSSISCAVIGFIWYIATRVRLLLLKYRN